MSPNALPNIRRVLQLLADTEDGVPPACEPSQRAQEIYRRVAVDCVPQNVVARDLGISPSRVSQVVRRVRTWLAQGSQPSADPLNRAERRRLEWALSKARHEGIIHRALRDYDHQHAHPTHTTTKTESNPSGADIPVCHKKSGAGFQPAINSPNPQPETAASPTANCPLSTVSQSEIGAPASAGNLKSEITKITTTTRPLPPPVQLLKAAQRSAIALDRLAERNDLPDPEPTNKMPDDKSLYWALISVLMHLRRRAEADGRVPHSTNIDKLLHNALSSLLGIDQGAGNGFFNLDDSVRHYLKSFLLPTVTCHPHNPEPQQLLTELLAENDSPAPATANGPLPTAQTLLNPEPRTLNTPPVNSPQLNPLPVPPNPSPTPSPQTPSVPRTQKPKPAPATPQPETWNLKPETSSPTSTVFATRFIPADPNITLKQALHPWSRPD